MAVTEQLFLARRPLNVLKCSYSHLAIVLRRSRPSSLSPFVALLLLPSRLSSLSSSFPLSPLRNSLNTSTLVL